MMIIKGQWGLLIIRHFARSLILITPIEWLSNPFNEYIFSPSLALDAHKHRLKQTNYIYNVDLKSNFITVSIKTVHVFFLLLHVEWKMKNLLIERFFCSFCWIWFAFNRLHVLKWMNWNRLRICCVIKWTECMFWANNMRISMRIFKLNGDIKRLSSTSQSPTLQLFFSVVLHCKEK